MHDIQVSLNGNNIEASLQSPVSLSHDPLSFTKHIEGVGPAAWAAWIVSYVP